MPKKQPRANPHFSGNARQFGSQGAPLLFDSSRQQRFLAYLAHKGPSRLFTALQAIGAPQIETLPKLAEHGLLVWDNRSRTMTLVALNERFPGIAHLKELLCQLEPRPCRSPGVAEKRTA